jgi:hypothetical protein
MPSLPSSTAADMPAGPPPMISTGTSISRSPAAGSSVSGRAGRPSAGSTACRGDQLRARFQRQAVGDHHALRALAVGAENALRRAIFVVVTKDADAAGKQRRGNRLLERPSAGLGEHLRLDFLALPEKGNLFALGDGQESDVSQSGIRA